MAGNKSYPISNLLSLVRTKIKGYSRSYRTCFCGESESESEKNSFGSGNYWSLSFSICPNFMKRACCSSKVRFVNTCNETSHDWLIDWVRKLTFGFGYKVDKFIYLVQDFVNWNALGDYKWLEIYVSKYCHNHLSQLKKRSGLCMHKAGSKKRSIWDFFSSSQYIRRQWMKN